MSVPSDYPIPPFQLRRGTYAQVQNYVPAVGELVFAIDTLQVYVGDGVKVGGWLIGGSGIGNYDFGTITNPNGGVLDFGTINDPANYPANFGTF